MKIYSVISFWAICLPNLHQIQVLYIIFKCKLLICYEFVAIVFDFVIIQDFKAFIV